MIDQDRRQHILQAEETIRQLAEQLAQVRLSKAAADDTVRDLKAACATLEKTKELLAEAIRTLQENSNQTVSALTDTRKQLEQAQEQVSGATAELYTAAQQLGEITPAIQQHLQKAVAEITNAVHESSQRQEATLKQKILYLQRLIWSLLVLIFLAFGASVAFLVKCN
jgi:ABC-type transporter Mla subunit MlaD